MTKNMGSIDKTVRLVVVLAIVALYALNVISGTVAIVLGVIGIVLAATSLVSFCPLYTVLGVSTKNK